VTNPATIGAWGKGCLTGFKVLPPPVVVERTFAWISKHRRCIRDYETLPVHHEVMVHIAMIMAMSRRLARTEDW
jgi:transposase